MTTNPVDTSVLRRRIEAGEVSFDARSGRYFVDKLTWESPDITADQNQVLATWKVAGAIEHEFTEYLSVHSVKMGAYGAIAVQHSENADWVIANLMNCVTDGSVSVTSNAHIELTNAINTYLLERGFTEAQLADLWTGAIQLTIS